MTYEIIPLHARAKNLTGRVFNRLTVIAPVGIKNKRVSWLCVCSCGTETEVVSSSLLAGRSKSCGCLCSEIVSEMLTKHGMHGIPEYRSWMGMNARCNCPTTSSYSRYGGRGIAVCAKWRASFASFYSDMGKKPTPKHSIDRIDNDSDYTPDNCRWATPRQQQNNTRVNRILTYKGESMTVARWSRKKGINYETLRKRVVNGWSVEKALTHPVQKYAI